MNPHRLVPEWELQDAIIIVWPHTYSDWANDLDQIEATYLSLCKYICEQQGIVIVAHDDKHVSYIQQLLSETSIDCKDMVYLTIPTNDTWVRDYGPVFTESDSEHILLDFEFDGWGQKHSYLLDNAFNAQLVEHLNSKAIYQPVNQVLEAGNFEINDFAELLCSKSCFGRNKREAETDFAKLEEQLENWLGCNKIYWVEGVQLAGDDTSGHIDTLARFCTNDVIVHSTSSNRNDPNYEVSAQLLTQLEAIKRQSFNRLELVPLPLPDPVFLSNQQLPATYTNFLITNNTVLVPVFNDKQDNHALKLLDELFTDKEIIDIESNTLIQQLGGLHCATMQIPKGVIM